MGDMYSSFYPYPRRASLPILPVMTMTSRTQLWLPAALALLLAAACGGDREVDRMTRSLDRAMETSRRVAQAEWTYERELRPPERGDTAPVEEDRCRITMPGEAERRDVACGLFFMALRPGADSARVERMVAAMGGEVLERQSIPGWATRLGDPVPYLLVSVPTGEEPRAIRRALAAEEVRFVDVRRVQRRRP
jgi:hypothetical protein